MSEQRRVPVEIPAHLQKAVGTPSSRFLEIERSRASFSVEGMKEYLHGKEYLEMQNRILPILQNDVSVVRPVGGAL